MVSIVIFFSRKFKNIYEGFEYSSQLERWNQEQFRINGSYGRIVYFVKIFFQRLRPATTIEFFTGIRVIIPVTNSTIKFRMAFTDFFVLDRTPLLLPRIRNVSVPGVYFG